MRGAAVRKLETARDVDVAVLERQAQEELGSLAKFWSEQLPEKSELREELRTLARLAPQEPLRPSA